MHASELIRGWSPATFVSSRGDRAKAKASRPEDYMDEEDLQELRESRTLVDTTEEMDLAGGTAAELKPHHGEDDTEQE
jgi:G patch domain-containing protein 1